jgi:hypothetical protein
VPYRHYLLAPLRAGLSAIAMVVMATVMTACSDSQAEAPPPPPPEVDAAQVVTKSVRQWDEFTGRIAAIGAVDIRCRHRPIPRPAATRAGLRHAAILLSVLEYCAPCESDTAESPRRGRSFGEWPSTHVRVSYGLTSQRTTL